MWAYRTSDEQRVVLTRFPILRDDLEHELRLDLKIKLVLTLSGYMFRHHAAVHNGHIDGSWWHLQLDFRGRARDGQPDWRWASVHEHRSDLPPSGAIEQMSVSSRQLCC